MSDPNGRKYKTPEGVTFRSAWTLGDGIWHCAGTKLGRDKSGFVVFETIRWTERRRQVSWWRRLLRILPNTTREV